MAARTATPASRPARKPVVGRPIAEFAVDDTVSLGRQASPQFVEPIRLLLTELPTASAIDYGGLRDLHAASWVYLTGYELDPRGHRLTIRTVLANVAGIVSLVPR